MALSEKDMLVTVWETEYKPLLDREKVFSDVKTHLQRWTNLIHDVVSYGSHLIPRCFSSSPRGLKDAIVIGVLLRQVVAMLDGVDILLTNGATHVAHLQMRALFEASVYIEWILQEDSERKASYYYVHNLRRKRFWAFRTQPECADSQGFLNMIKEGGVVISDAAKQSSKQLIQEIDRVLAQPTFALVNQDFDKHKKKNRDVAWYVPFGPNSFAAIARLVKREPYYAIFYSISSGVMHSSSYDAHIVMGEKKRITFQPIRWLDQFQPVFHFSVSMAMLSFWAMLSEYRPEERAAFSRKYLEKWQRDLTDFVKIVYKSEQAEI